MLTSIGKFLRKLRMSNGEILRDMAEALEVSSAISLKISPLLIRSFLKNLPILVSIAFPPS